VESVRIPHRERPSLATCFNYMVIFVHYFCYAKKHREVFDRIVEKSANDEEALKAVPGQTEAIILNQMIDMEERLRLLEQYKA
jgi:hypothetical protein